MSGLDLLKRNVQGLNPASYTPTGLGEVTAANTYSFSLQQTLGIPKLAFQAQEASEFNNRNNLIKNRFNVSDPFDLIDTSDIEAKYKRPTTEGRIKMLNEKQSRLDAFIEENRNKQPEQWKGIKTKKEIETPLRDEARFAAATAEEIASRASPASAVAGTIIGGFGGAMTDVVNIATLPLGFGSSMGVLKTIAAEGALNAAIEATQIKGRSEWMNELGFKYGLKEAALDVAFAGGGAAAIVGAVRSGGAAFRSLQTRGSKGVEVLSKASEDTTLPSEVRDALKYQARVSHIDEETPVVNPTREEVAVHRANAEETQNAIREYRQPDYKDAPIIPETTVFHGTNAMSYSGSEKINVFNTNPPSGRGGTYFTTSRNVAKEYGEQIYSADVKLENPLIVYADGARWDGIDKSKKVEGKITNKLKEKREVTAKEDEKLLSELGIGGTIPKKQKLETLQDLDGLPDGMLEIDDIAKAARRLGYDGVVVKDVKDSPLAKIYSDEVADTYVVFNSENIKRTNIDNPILTRETSPLEAMRETSEVMEQSIPAFEADFARLLKEKPDMEIDMDGATVRLSDIADEIKQNNNILDAIRTCAIG